MPNQRAADSKALGTYLPGQLVADVRSAARARGEETTKYVERALRAELERNPAPTTASPGPLGATDRTVGSTAGGKVHQFADGLAACSNGNRPVHQARQLGTLAEVSDSTLVVALARIVKPGPEAWCGRCFNRRVRAAAAALQGAP
jgi:hypothetical protein